MDGNTTRINRILRRSIRLSTLLIRSNHPSRNRRLSRSNNRPMRNSHLTHSNNRRRITRHQATIRTGLDSRHRRVTSSLSRIWGHRWDMVRAWNTSISMRPSPHSRCRNCARSDYSN